MKMKVAMTAKNCHETKWVKVGKYQVLCSDSSSFKAHLKEVDIFIGLDAYAYRCGEKIGILPIEDGSVDDKVVDAIERIIRRGDKVGFGCTAGHGRTGYVLGELIHRIEKFPKSTKLINEVRKRWCNEAVETKIQIETLEGKKTEKRSLIQKPERLKQSPIKVWLDAYRCASKGEGWTWVKTQKEAIALLKTDRVEMISLYHDSGANKNTGYKLILDWIKDKIYESDFQPPFIEIYGFCGGILDYKFWKCTPAQRVVEQIENLWFEKELSRATKENNLEKVNLLINTGVHISGSKDSPGSIPPILLFSARGCSRAVKLLLDSGTDIQKTHYGLTALDLAIWNGHAETAGILRSAGLKESGPIEKNTALMSTVRKNDLGKVKFWLKSGADVNASDPLGETVLIRAAGKRNRAKLVKLLIDAGADVNTQHKYMTRDGRERWSDTAVMRAVHNGCALTVKILIDAGADVNLECYGWTVLETAAQEGRYGIVKLLLATGADVNAVKNKLIINTAAWSGYAKIIKILRAAGAKEDNRTKGLEKMGELIKAVKDGNIAAVNRLILAGADVNIRDSNNWPLIMNAACYGHAAIVKSLIAAGADVNTRDEDYPLTALIVAEGKHRQKIIRMLRKAGAK